MHTKYLIRPILPFWWWILRLVCLTKEFKMTKTLHMISVSRLFLTYFWSSWMTEGVTLYFIWKNMKWDILSPWFLTICWIIGKYLHRNYIVSRVKAVNMLVTHLLWYVLAQRQGYTHSCFNCLTKLRSSVRTAKHQRTHEEPHKQTSQNHSNETQYRSANDFWLQEDFGRGLRSVLLDTWVFQACAQANL